MAYASWSVVQGEQPTAAKWNILGTNDAYFDTQVGSGLGSTSSTVWWQELGRTTLGSAGDTITVSGFTARKYLQIHFLIIPSGNINARFTLNNDTGNNYATAFSADSAAASTTTSAALVELESSNGTFEEHGVINMRNPNGAIKMGKAHVTAGTSSAAAAPQDFIVAFKYASNTQVTRIDLLNSGTGDMAAGSEVVVLGHD